MMSAGQKAQQANRDGDGEYAEKLMADPGTAVIVDAPPPFRCSKKCWTQVRCPDHGNLMSPCGRSAGIYAYPCCDKYMSSRINTMHLWDEHDSTRTYTDPEGWADHESRCTRCGPTTDEE